IFAAGIYLMIFGACVQVTWREKDRLPNSILYLAGTVSLFVLATIANAFETWEFVRQATIEHEALRTQEFEELARFLAGDEIKTIQRCFRTKLCQRSDSEPLDFQIHRCHVIWGSRKRIGYPLFIISILLNELKLVNTGGIMNSSFFVCIAVFNTVLTLMTGARIWWITRQARALMGSEVDQRYRTIVAIILESGWIYPAVLIINATVEFATEVDTILPVSIDPLIWQFAVSVS
ncbi:hypothetical protein K435DRAFT_932542, partial [Dendrothele bispora CBS 962.96]